MALLADLVRTTGNVLLRPVKLTALPGMADWCHAELAGSVDPAVITAAEQALRTVAPALDAWPAISRGVCPPDVVVLLLTGEGRAREKFAALFHGAPTLLAVGVDGQWYRIHLPPLAPASLRWWGRLATTITFVLGYLALIWGLGLLSLIRRLLPLPPPVPAPGSPFARTVTFIIPNYNQRRLMDFCLPPLLAEAGDQHKVLLVDDASSDGTCDFVWRHYPSVEVVRLSHNQGFAGAVRAGIEASTTPLFALINTDVQMRPGFLQAILPHFDDPATFAVCSRIDLPEGSPMETGNVATAWSGMLEPYHLPPTKSGPILYAGGASSVYDRAKYDALDGFEVVYRPLYFEDIELGYRAWRRGWQSLFEPSASVFHQRRAWVGARFGDDYANETFLKNGLLFTWKNLRDPGMMAEHCAYVCARLVCEVLAGERMMARAIWRALPSYGRMARKRWQDYRRGDRSDRAILQQAQPSRATVQDTR